MESRSLPCYKGMLECTWPTREIWLVLPAPLPLSEVSSMPNSQQLDITKQNEICML